MATAVAWWWPPGRGSDGSAHGIRLSAEGAVEEKGEKSGGQNGKKAQHNTGNTRSQDIVEVHAGTQAKPLKGGRRIMPVARIFLHSWSRLPMMNDNHGDDAGNDICYGEVAHAGGAQCNHGKKGPVIEGKDRGGSHICFITKFACQGGIDDAVGIGYGSDDSQGASPRNPASPNSALSRSPRPKPIKNLRAVRTTPFHTVLPAIFTSMVAPLQNRNRPIRVGTRS